MYQLLSVLSSLFNFYEWLIVIWCILSWLPIAQEGIAHDLAAAIDSLVRPYMSLFQRFIPPLGGIDFSPIVAILALGLIQNVLFRLIYLIL